LSECLVSVVRKTRLEIPIRGNGATFNDYCSQGSRLGVSGTVPSSSWPGRITLVLMLIGASWISFKQLSPNASH
jgi:hypothetical protein